MALKWSDDLSVGVAKIDEQHKELITRINSLVEAMSHGEGSEACGELMDFLGDYVVEHFSAEEKEMVRRKYRGYDAHKTEHEKFIKAFGQYKADYLSNKNRVLVEIRIQSWLHEWLRNHIRTVDMAMGAFLKQQPDIGKATAK